MIIFCSDVHLRFHPEQTPDFSVFLNTLPKTTQGLFILGDLFEAWWGDDHHYTPYTAWEHILSQLSAPIYFLAGNRDFLCKKDFFLRTKLQPLASGSMVHYAGHRFGLLHGDEPGFLLEPGYQIMRSVLRTNALQKLFLSLPHSFRQKTAGQIRSYSRPPKHLEVDCKSWEQRWPLATAFIHGHLHEQKEHYGERCIFYQLGCWDQGQKSALIVHPDGQISWLE